ncbi:MAG: class II fructose-bisphosphate aldolase, partial [Firmicutes bacterium]|nr:class II fructose-bisphosphate aldolase [Bacillota bacterium]
SKINVNTECQVAFSDAVKKYYAEKRDEESKGYTQREIFKTGIAETKRVCIEKMTMFGSLGKA